MIFKNVFGLSKMVQLSIVSAALVAGLLVTLLSAFLTRDTVRNAAQSKLTAVVEARHEALTQWFGNIEADLTSLAADPATLNALMAFKAGWNSLEANPQQYLQDAYIRNNPHPTGGKHTLITANDGSDYSRVHAAYHPFFKTYLERKGYYDIFLFDTQGNLVYTVFKELDFATNMLNGEWAKTDLAEAFRASRTAADAGNANKISFFDFKPYAPSYGAAASFISHPLVDKNGAAQGVLVFQMPIDTLNRVMQSKAGLGETGESFFVGQDRLMRNDTVRSEGKTLLTQSVASSYIRDALLGERGITKGESYRGHETLAAYMPLEYRGTAWALVVEQALEEIYAPATSAVKKLGLQVLLIVTVLAAFGFFLGRRLVAPIGHITEKMMAVANEDLTVDIPHTQRSDEVGDMARTLEVFRDSAKAANAMRAQQERQREEHAQEEAARRSADAQAQRERSEAERQQLADNEENVRSAVCELADQIELELNAAIRHMVEQTNTLSSAAQQVSSNAANVTDDASKATTNANEALGSAQTVASAAEELFASIKEISRQVGHSATLTKETVQSAGETRKTIADLENAAAGIHEVVSLISDIAAQTNLLALNATIEAARAGDAGKGFAVVAGEVKSLASQTAKSTQEISERISTIQKVVGQAVSAIDGIHAQIGEVEAVSVDIAGAIEQQSGATEEIARSVGGASEAVSAVVERISTVSKEARESAVGAKSVEEASATLYNATTQMRQKLIALVRTATPAADRRNEERTSTRVDCTVTEIPLSHAGLASYQGMITDASDKGCCVVLSDRTQQLTSDVQLDISAINMRINGRAVGQDAGVVRIAFETETPGFAGKISAASGLSANAA